MCIIVVLLLYKTANATWRGANAPDEAEHSIFFLGGSGGWGRGGWGGGFQIFMNFGLLEQYNHRWTSSMWTLVITKSLEPIAFVVLSSTCF